MARIANVGRTTAGAVMRELETAGHVLLAYRRIPLLSLNDVRARLGR